MSTIPISEALYRHVDPQHVAYLHQARELDRSLLVEAKAATTNPHLDAWKPESRELVDLLEARIAAHDEKAAAFKITLTPLEEAVANEAAARAEHERAQAAWGLGSLDRKENLRLRDDRDHADRVLIVRRRELEAATRNSRARLPGNNGVPQGPGRELIEAITLAVRRRTYQARSTGGYEGGGFKATTEVTAVRGAVAAAVWRGLVEGIDDLKWIPVYAARHIAAAEKELESKKQFHTSGALMNKDEVEQAAAEISDFVAELERFKKDHEAHRRMQAEEHKKQLDAARVLLAGAA
jgi:hypothetical protein